MSRPVENWKIQVDETSIYFDIADENLRFFGPRPAWRTLSRRDLGPRKAIFSGIVDMGYELSEIQALSANLPGKKVLPLPISGLSQEPELSIEISSPHVGGLVSLNTLPFTQYRLAITIDLQAENANSLITAIQKGWSEKTLLNGKYKSSADGLVAEGGYKTIIDAKSCINDIISHGALQTLSTAEAWQALYASIRRHQQKWLVYYGAAESQDERSLAEAALSGLLFDRCFDQVTAIRYDNGMLAMSSRLRDGLTMGDAESRILVLSRPAKIIAEFGF